MPTYQFDNTDGVVLKEWVPVHEAYLTWPGKGEVVIRKPTRTPLQNRAIHKWFTLLSHELNKTGVPLAVSIGSRAPIKRLWDMEAVKRELYHPLMTSITKKTSTAKLTTREIDLVADPLRQWLADEWEIEVPFPSEESLVLNMILNQ